MRLKSRSAGMSHLELAAMSLVLACAATSTLPALPELPTNSLVLAYLAASTESTPNAPAALLLVLTMIRKLIERERR